MNVRLYTDGHKWYIQDILLGYIIGRYSSKRMALDFIARKNWCLGV